MPNFFDQFDPTPQPAAASAGVRGNFFDQFDAAPSRSSDQLDAASARPSGPLQITVRPPGATEPPKPEAPPVSQGRALMEGVLSGASANFRDEVLGASEASGLPEWMGGFRAPVGAVRLAYEALTEPGQASETYDKTVKSIREVQKQAEKEYPGTTLAGELAGALILPVGAGAAKGATLAERLGRNALIGAGYGAASGAGAGETPTDRAIQAGTGAVTGGAIGAAVPAALEGVTRGVQAAAQPVVTAVRGALQPDAEAAARVVNAIRRDAAADPAAARRLTTQEFATAPDARLVDLGGDLTRRLADVAGIASPEAKTGLVTFLDERFAGQHPRVTGWLNKNFGFPNAQKMQEAIDNVERGVNNAAYRKAYQEGAGGLWSPELERLAGSDAVSAAMQAAAKAAKDESIISGYGAMNPRVTFAPDGRIQFKRSPSGVPTYPDLQFWDLARRKLSDAAREAGPGTSDARRYEAFAQALNAELDRLVPSYREARAGAAAFFGAEKAHDAGQKFVMENFNNRGAQAALAKMSDAERALFQQGFVSRFIETLDRVGDRRSILNKIADSPAAKDKLDIAIGKDKARELEAMLRIEGIMDLARQAIKGNSWTAQRLYDLGLLGAGGIGGSGIYSQDPQQITYGAILAALSSGGKKLDQRVLRKVAEMLASDNIGAYQKGIKLVGGTSRVLDALRALDKRIAAVSGEQSPAGLLTTGAVPGRADGQQNQ